MVNQRELLKEATNAITASDFDKLQRIIDLGLELMGGYNNLFDNLYELLRTASRHDTLPCLEILFKSVPNSYIVAGNDIKFANYLRPDVKRLLEQYNITLNNGYKTLFRPTVGDLLDILEYEDRNKEIDEININDWNVNGAQLELDYGFKLKITN